MLRPSGRATKDETWPRRPPTTARFVPVSISHSRIVPSVPAETTRFPSGMTATVRTMEVCPRIILTQDPVLTFQTRTFICVKDKKMIRRSVKVNHGGPMDNKYVEKVFIRPYRPILAA